MSTLVGWAISLNRFNVQTIAPNAVQVSLGSVLRAALIVSHSVVASSMLKKILARHQRKRSFKDKYSTATASQCDSRHARAFSHLNQRDSHDRLCALVLSHIRVKLELIRRA